MGLLDKIEKKVAKHPLSDETYETKVNYLNAIAFFIAIDDSITDAEKESFDKIIDMLDCDGAKEDLYDFMENPNLDEFENTFKFLDEKDYFITYLLEVFSLNKEASLNSAESRFIDMIVDMLGYIKDEINTISEFADVDENKAVILFKKIIANKKLFQKSQEFYNYYKLSHQKKKRLKEINTKQIKILEIGESLKALFIQIEKDSLATQMTSAFTGYDITLEISKIENIEEIIIMAEEKIASFDKGVSFTSILKSQVEVSGVQNSIEIENINKLLVTLKKLKEELDAIE